MLFGVWGWYMYVNYIRTCYRWVDFIYKINLNKKNNGFNIKNK